MSTDHARSGSLVELDPGTEGAGLISSIALVRDDRMEVMRWVLPAGRRVPEHLAYGPVTVQCLAGVASLRLQGAQRMLTPGTLVYLAAGERHALEALADAVLLVTMVLVEPHGPARAGPGQVEPARPMHGERTDGTATNK
jgi:quercetin dioxygenase-like cupin family protein